MHLEDQMLRKLAEDRTREQQKQLECQTTLMNHSHRVISVNSKNTLNPFIQPTNKREEEFSELYHRMILPRLSTDIRKAFSSIHSNSNSYQQDSRSQQHEDSLSVFAPTLSRNQEAIGIRGNPEQKALTLLTQQREEKRDSRIQPDMLKKTDVVDNRKKTIEKCNKKTLQPDYNRPTSVLQYFRQATPFSHPILSSDNDHRTVDIDGIWKDIEDKKRNEIKDRLSMTMY